MSKTILYIAMSLDGYIARKNGDIDWLNIVETKEEDYGYSLFYNSIDCLIMGSKTYAQISEFGFWPYTDKMTYVLSTHQHESIDDNILITNTEPQHLIAQLPPNTRVWLVGGGKLAQNFLERDLVNEINIAIVPLLLGEGIRLFDKPLNETHLQLLESTQYPSGLVQLLYSVPKMHAPP